MWGRSLATVSCTFCWPIFQSARSMLVFFKHFKVQIELSLQSGAHFADLIFQKCSVHFTANRALATVAYAFSWWCGWHDDGNADHDNRAQLGSFLTKLPLIIRFAYDICLYAHLPIDLSTYLSTCLPTNLSIYLSICLSIYLHTNLFIYLSIHPSSHPSIHLSICKCKDTQTNIPKICEETDLRVEMCKHAKHVPA